MKRILLIILGTIFGGAFTWYSMRRREVVREKIVLRERIVAVPPNKPEPGEAPKKKLRPWVAWLVILVIFLFGLAGGIWWFKVLQYTPEATSSTTLVSSVVIGLSAFLAAVFSAQDAPKNRLVDVLQAIGLVLALIGSIFLASAAASEMWPKPSCAEYKQEQSTSMKGQALDRLAELAAENHDCIER